MELGCTPSMRQRAVGGETAQQRQKQEQEQEEQEQEAGTGVENMSYTHPPPMVGLLLEVHLPTGRRHFPRHVHKHVHRLQRKAQRRGIHVSWCVGASVRPCCPQIHSNTTRLATHGNRQLRAAATAGSCRQQ